MTRRAILLKWILYCLCALALALLQGLVLVYVRVWGVHPFLLPAIAVIPATLERNEQALLYAVFFGLVCDLLSPVTGLPCFYALAFLLGAAAAWLLSGQVIMAGVVCSLVVTGVCMLLCGLLHMAVLAGHSGAGLTARACCWAGSFGIAALRGGGAPAVPVGTAADTERMTIGEPSYDEKSSPLPAAGICAAGVFLCVSGAVFCGAV